MSWCDDCDQSLNRKIVVMQCHKNINMVKIILIKAFCVVERQTRRVKPNLWPISTLTEIGLFRKCVRARRRLWVSYPYVRTSCIWVFYNFFNNTSGILWERWYPNDIKIRFSIGISLFIYRHSRGLSLRALRFTWSRPFGQKYFICHFDESRNCCGYPVQDLVVLRLDCIWEMAWELSSWCLCRPTLVCPHYIVSITKRFAVSKPHKRCC